MANMTRDEINTIIDRHAAWLRGDPSGQRANLSGANLYGANLRGANLYGADLRSANLSSADLRSANLYGANLYGANLYGADLRGADLYGANLYGADLRGAKHDASTQWGPRQTLPDGVLQLWKKVHVSGCQRIALLRVPADADRTSSYVGRKVRCSFAIVERLEMLDGTPAAETEAVSGHRSDCVYRVGEMVVPDEWDPNPLVECTHGIHAFVTREEAVGY